MSVSNTLYPTESNNAFCMHIRQVSDVLLGDFDRAGGPSLLNLILQSTAPERFMRTISIYTRLLFDHTKLPCDQVLCASVGAVLQSYLASILYFDRIISSADSTENLIELCARLYSSHREDIKVKEYALQGIAYSLLTMYSNDPHSCNLLEDAYHYLPMMILALPALESFDTIAAVLTTLNYVCQCVESCTAMALSALSAATSVMTNIALNTGISSPSSSRSYSPLLSPSPSPSPFPFSPERPTLAFSGNLPASTPTPTPSQANIPAMKGARALAIRQLDLTFASFEAIVRSNAHYVPVLMMKGGNPYTTDTTYQSPAPLSPLTSSPSPLLPHHTQDC